MTREHPLIEEHAMDGISTGIVANPSSADLRPVPGEPARRATREKPWSPAFVLSLTLACLISANLEGQVMTVTGTVVDSVTTAALPNVDVYLDGVGPVTTTDIRGTLRLPGVGVGTHTLRFVALGYRVREVEVTLEAERTIDLDIGTVALVPLPTHRISLTGTVRDADNNHLRVPASVALNGRTVAVTDDSGSFDARVSAYEGDNAVTVNALGYATAQQRFQLQPQVNELQFDIRLDPSAVELEPVGVEADAAVAPHLREFERRRRAGSGRYLTAEEIEEMNPISTTDVLRRVLGVTVRDDPVWGPRIHISNTRYYCDPTVGRYTPVFFLDGVRLLNSQVDGLLTPDRLAGVEVYRSPSTMPAEFQVGMQVGSLPAAPAPGSTDPARDRVPTSNCGAIALWTKAVEIGDTSPFELGVRYGGMVSNGSLAVGRFGVHLVTTFFGPLEFYPAVHVIINRPSAGGGVANAGWHVQLAIRGRPLGRETPWYVGGGVAVVDHKIVLRIPGFSDLVLEPGDEEAGLDLFTGAALRFGMLQPFVEIHAFKVFSGVEGQLFGGVGMQF